MSDSRVSVTENGEEIKISVVTVGGLDIEIRAKVGEKISTVLSTLGIDTKNSVLRVGDEYVNGSDQITNTTDTIIVSGKASGA